DFCGHATGELEEYITEAFRKRFVEIGFSAHLPKVTEPDPYHAMLEQDLPRYVERVRELQERYSGRITIKLGIEADYFAGHEAETRRLIDAYPFDYVLGSLHFLGDWHFTSRVGLDRYRTENPDSAYARYFELIGRLIKSDLFDVLAHPDAIRRAGFSPNTPMDDTYRDIAVLLRERGMAIEVNTAGIRRRTGSLYPEPAFLAAAAREGVPVTIGSDAHAPGDVGRDFQTAFRLLRDVGIREVATFAKRRMTMRRLSDFSGSAVFRPA
ncbi:MAG TPA: histidinol-phosphatase HisJ family protein, partial [Patescibacteria group bacterium]|nr:histidinol-phosphatase HisJ family protein [Patescibacteria group bacterium]